MNLVRIERNGIKNRYTDTGPRRPSVAAVGAATTSPNLALPAVGFRLPHRRRSSGWRRCGSAWSLGDITREEILTMSEKIIVMIPL